MKKKYNKRNLNFSEFNEDIHLNIEKDYLRL